MTRPVETEAKTANPADVLVSRPSLLEYRHFARLIAVFVFILSPRKWQNPLVNLRNATQFAMLDVDLDQVMTINRVIVFLRAGHNLVAERRRIHLAPRRNFGVTSRFRFVVEQTNNVVGVAAGIRRI